MYNLLREYNKTQDSSINFMEDIDSIFMGLPNMDNSYYLYCIR